LVAGGGVCGHGSSNFCRPTFARSVALALLLATAAAAGFGSAAWAQSATICGTPYGGPCALPGWDDPIDEQCLVLETGLPIILPAAVPPCFPNTVMGAP
jgi:hypothetical protein